LRIVSCGNKRRIIIINYHYARFRLSFTSKTIFHNRLKTHLFLAKLPTQLLPACRTLQVWNKLPPTLRVSYQFDPSSSPSSSSSSCSDPGPLVDQSRGVFHFCLKTFLSQSLSPHSRLSFLRLISWNYDHLLFGMQSLAAVVLVSAAD